MAGKEALWEVTKEAEAGVWQAVDEVAEQVLKECPRVGTVSLEVDGSWKWDLDPTAPRLPWIVAIDRCRELVWDLRCVRKYDAAREATTRLTGAQRNAVRLLCLPREPATATCLSDARKRGWRQRLEVELRRRLVKLAETTEKGVGNRFGASAVWFPGRIEDGALLVSEEQGTIVGWASHNWWRLHWYFGHFAKSEDAERFKVFASRTYTVAFSLTLPARAIVVEGVVQDLSERVGNWERWRRTLKKQAARRDEALVQGKAKDDSGALGMAGKDGLCLDLDTPMLHYVVALPDQGKWTLATVTSRAAAKKIIDGWRAEHPFTDLTARILDARKEGWAAGLVGKGARLSGERAPTGR